MLRRAFENHPERFVSGIPKPPTLPEQPWINKPKKVSSGNDSGPISTVNLLFGGVGPENGFHNCPISNERESGRDPGRGQIQVSQALVQ